MGKTGESAVEKWGVGGVRDSEFGASVEVSIRASNVMSVAMSTEVGVMMSVVTKKFESEIFEEWGDG